MHLLRLPPPQFDRSRWWYAPRPCIHPSAGAEYWPVGGWWTGANTKLILISFKVQLKHHLCVCTNWYQYHLILKNKDIFCSRNACLLPQYFNLACTLIYTLVSLQTLNVDTHLMVLPQPRKDVDAITQHLQYHLIIPRSQHVLTPSKFWCEHRSLVWSCC